MASTFNQVEEEFAEAANNWSLEKLYIDLASAKGKGLTPVEKKILRGLLCGYSPAEIAVAIYKTRTSSSVRVYLSNALYKYIQEMLTSQSGIPIKISHWSRIISLLEKAGYKNKISAQYNLINPTESEPISSPNLVSADRKYYDWGEAIDVCIFYGRQQELAQLQEWIINDRCRLVALLGMGGIGKTALSVRIAEKIKDKFDYVIWRSLHHAPPVDELLANLIQFLISDRQSQINLADTTTGRISQLIECLRNSRCLLVLDHVDSVLQANYLTGYFQPEYEGYRELFQRVGDTFHQSCLILTSREQLKEIAFMEGSLLPVRYLPINGLNEIDCLNLIKDKGLPTLADDYQALINRYGRNPLAIKMVLTTICELFDGNIRQFLNQNILGFGSVRELLEQHLNRLSEKEIKLIEWLVINQELVLGTDSPEPILPAIPKGELMETLESLQRRSIISQKATIFKLQPIFRQYLNEQNRGEKQAKKISGVLKNIQVNSCQVPGKLNNSPDANEKQTLTGEQYIKGNESLPHWYDGSW